MAPDSASGQEAAVPRPRDLPEAPQRRGRGVPLGRIAGARRATRGNANVGLWVLTPDEYRWLAHY